MHRYRSGRIRADGKAIDFRGVPARTINGKSGTLADTNQRLSKGFAPSFATELTWGKVRVAKFRLDWIFVKSELENPRDEKGPYVFAHARGPERLPGGAAGRPQSDHGRSADLGVNGN